MKNGAPGRGGAVREALVNGAPSGGSDSTTATFYGEPRDNPVVKCVQLERSTQRPRNNRPGEHAEKARATITSPGAARSVGGEKRATDERWPSVWRSNESAP